MATHHGLEILAGGQAMRLLPQRALYLEQAQALLVADVHLGKAASFRALGVPVPETTTDRTLSRLDALLRQWPVSQLIVLGDLLHGPAAQASPLIAALTRWREAWPGVRVILVRGNHDDRAGDPPPACGIEVVAQPFALGDLHLCHEPPSSPEGFSLAGHLHPAHRLRDRFGSVRLPCFWFRERGAVLPAFGEFTGGMAVDPSPGDRLYLCDAERIHALPSRSVDAA